MRIIAAVPVATPVAKVVTMSVPVAKVVTMSVPVAKVVPVLPLVEAVPVPVGTPLQVEPVVGSDKVTFDITVQNDESATGISDVDVTLDELFALMLGGIHIVSISYDLIEHVIEVCRLDPRNKNPTFQFADQNVEERMNLMWELRDKFFEEYCINELDAYVSCMWDSLVA